MVLSCEKSSTRITSNWFIGSGMIAQIVYQSIGELGEFSSITFLDAQITSDWHALYPEVVE